MRVLLVTGPPGCGKSATLRVLSKELGFDIKEWINPVLEAYDQTSMVARSESGNSMLNVMSLWGGEEYLRHVALFSTLYSILPLWGREQYHRHLVLFSTLYSILPLWGGEQYLVYLYV